jgi:hypothetical protein
MGNVKIIFLGCENSRTDGHELEVFANDSNQLFISIEMNSPKSQCDGEAFLCLDKSTAIKFSKELRKQIALLNN